LAFDGVQGAIFSRGKAFFDKAGIDLVGVD
jgi:hypothetical protein